MKIIGQSTILHKPPYFHLAYLAASSRIPSRGYLGAGLFVLLFGFILSSQLAKRKHKAKEHWIQTPVVLRKDNPTLLKVGLVCSVIGCTIVILSFVLGERRYVRPAKMTQIRIHVLRHLISTHLELGELIPADITSLSTEWELPTSRIQDGWSNEMRLTRTMEEGTTKYVIVSAGRDKVFDTDDDLKSGPISCQQKESEASS